MKFYGILRVFVVILYSVTVIDSLSLNFTPEALIQVQEESGVHRIEVGLVFSENESSTTDQLLRKSVFSLTVLNPTPWLVEITNSTTYFHPEVAGSVFFKTTSFGVSPILLGHVQLGFRIELLQNTSNSKSTKILAKEDAVATIPIDLPEKYTISIVRKEVVFNKIFIVAISILVLINNVNMGCQLDLGIIRDVFKRPVGPAVGFCSQFAFMPLASFTIAYFLFDDDVMRLGLFTLGCSPGGTNSNFWTLLFRGDINLSITMTFVSTLAAVGMMPLWLFTLGRQFYVGGHIEIPYLNLMISLCFLTIPIGIGIIIRRLRPNWAATSKKVLRPLTIIIMIFGFTVGILTSLFIFTLMTWRMVLAGFCVAWGGYLFGAIAARLFCVSPEQVIAISIETALQNAGLVFILLKLSLPDPDGDLAAIPAVAQLLGCQMTLWVAYIIYTIRRKVRESKKKKNAKNNVKKIRPMRKKPTLKLDRHMSVTESSEGEEDEDEDMIVSHSVAMDNEMNEISVLSFKPINADS